jgi:hypothetical protein
LTAFREERTDLSLEELNVGAGLGWLLCRSFFGARRPTNYQSYE